VIADQEQGIARRAHVALPAAAWAEVSGTITNRQGHVQRMHAALTPPGKAIPAWEILVRLARACGAAVAYDSPKAVFEELRTRVGPLEGAVWGREARSIQLRWANSRG
jgi:predicted molibdopterin-dependent oxidoreductase YjgC